MKTLKVLKTFRVAWLKMQINIIIFGQLCEILGENLVLNNIADTDSLTTVLNEKYPGLIDSKYLMAVNKKLVTQNTHFTNNATVALLPPFSGG
ncbi:MAG: MoaD/ThiS family protein [Ginsengibacter sp.]